MNKKYFTLFALCLSCSLYTTSLVPKPLSILSDTITCHAADIDLFIAATSHNITTQVIYQGIVTPYDSLPWTEVIDGETYSGTLTLQSYRPINGDTYATYSGTIYLQK